VVFTELYKLVVPEFRRRWERSYGDPHDGEEAFHVALTELLRDWRSECGNFLTMLNLRYKSRLIDRRRKAKKRDDGVEYSLDEPIEVGKSKNEAATLIEDERANVEATVIKKTTESARQGIIDHLLHPVTSDYATTAIVAVLKKPSYEFESPTSLGKAAGLHHEVVKRKLRALSRRYDGSRFGDIRDYLAV